MGERKIVVRNRKGTEKVKDLPTGSKGKDTRVSQQVVSCTTYQITIKLKTVHTNTQALIPLEAEANCPWDERIMTSGILGKKVKASRGKGRALYTRKDKR